MIIKELFHFIMQINHESSVPASKYTAQSQAACVCMQKMEIIQAVLSQFKHAAALF